MKICFIANEKFGIGGVSRVLSRILNSLCEEHEISLYLLRNPPLINAYGIKINKIAFYHREMSFIEKIRRSIVDKIVYKTSFFSSEKGSRIYARLRYTRSFKYELIEYLNENKFDVVIFASGFEDSLLLALIQPFLDKSIKIISWSHASYNDYFYMKPQCYSIYLSHVLKLYYHRFNQIIVLSDYDREEFQKKQNLRTIRIYNPTSFDVKENVQMRTKSFVYVGTLSHQKGIDILLDAFKRFLEENKDWSLNIYGNGILREYVENFIYSNKLESFIFYHGNVLHIEDELIKYSVFVLPSRFEGFGLVQVEAMSCGLPVIVSDIPIGKELVESRGIGWLFKCEDASSLCHVMLEITKLDLCRFSEKALIFSKKFEIHNITREWNKMLQDLMQ